jgi:hypothetical protein
VVFAGLLLLGQPGLAQDASLEAFVRFNTVCASCHEGQCSGRLSLDWEADGVESHVRRYAPAIPDAQVRELCALLASMKQECRLPPFPVAPPADRRWSGELLGRFSLPSRTHWFLPLGRVGAGRWTLGLAGVSASAVRVEIVDESFELLADDSVGFGAAPAAVAFAVEEASTLHARITAREPVDLREVALTRARPAGRASEAPD